MPEDIRRVWLPFADVRKSTTTTADGTEVPTRIVTGIMTDETLDLDGQIVDFESAKKAAGEWFSEWANVREQHSQNAVGTGIEMQVNDALKQIVTTIEVVDPTAVLKIDKGIYKGQSVGLKGARVVKDALAPNGRLVGFTQVEDSIVDRPANPSAKLAVVKMAKDGSLEPGPALTISEAEVKKIAGSDETKLAEVKPAAPPVDATKADDGEHSASLAAASAAIRAVLVEEASEDEPGNSYQLSYLVDALQRLEWFRNAEMYEYSEAYLSVVPELQKAVEAKDAKRAIALLRTAEVGTAMALKAAGVDVAKGHTVEVKPDGTVTSWRDESAGEESKSVSTDPNKAAAPAAAETEKADAHSHVHTHEGGSEFEYQHDHGHAHDDDGMHAEGEGGDHRHDHSTAKSLLAAGETVEPEPATEPTTTKAATSAETDKGLTADTLKAAVLEAVTKAFDERVKPLEETVAEMAKKAAPGGAYLVQRTSSAPGEVKAALLADKVKQATSLLEHNDPTVRLWAQQALQELAGGDD